MVLTPEAVLLEIIARHFKQDAEKITPDTDIVEEFAPDSLDIMEIVIEFEKSSGKKVPDDLIADMRTAQDLVGAAR